MNQKPELPDHIVAKLAEELWVRRLMNDGPRAMELVRCVYATGRDVYTKAVKHVQRRFDEMGIDYPKGRSF